MLRALGQGSDDDKPLPPFLTAIISPGILEEMEGEDDVRERREGPRRRGVLSAEAPPSVPDGLLEFFSIEPGKDLRPKSSDGQKPDGKGNGEHGTDELGEAKAEDEPDETVPSVLAFERWWKAHEIWSTCYNSEEDGCFQDPEDWSTVEHFQRQISQSNVLEVDEESRSAWTRMPLKLIDVRSVPPYDLYSPEEIRKRRLWSLGQVAHGVVAILQYSTLGLNPYNSRIPATGQQSSVRHSDAAPLSPLSLADPRYEALREIWLRMPLEGSGIKVESAAPSILAAVDY